MSRTLVRRAIFTLGVLMALAAPSTAMAWTVTVHIHGAGMVDDIDRGAGFDCTIPTTNRSEGSVEDCVLGSPDGVYNSGNIVELRAVVPAEHLSKGWRFMKWVDVNGNASKVNCDPQDTAGDHFGTNCKFQIFQNLDVHLYFEDVAGPQDTTLSTATPATTKSTSASFSFNSPSESTDARYQCRLDTPSQTGSYSLCGGPSDKGESYNGLTANGTYTFLVRAMDPTGNVDDTPASHTWTVDTVAPTALIAGTPAHGSITKSTSASLTGSSEPGSTVVCRLGAGQVPCNFSATGLSDGTHTFTAQATDAAGNTGPLATRTWTVDTVAPIASISGTPAQDARSKEPVNLIGSSNDGTVVCRLDGTERPCTLNEALPDGPHTFTATATDAAGNAGTATRSFTIDTAAPVITFTSGPAEGSVTNDTSPDFAFSANENGSAFTCALDSEQDADFAPCTALTGLSQGAHTLRVRMTDHAGNTATAQRTWTIDTAVPDTTLLSGPAEGSTSASSGATFEFASPESGTSFECSLDGAAFTACASPLALTGLTNDDHVFEVRARDAAGNVDATPARRAWRVNTLDADGDGINRPTDCDDTNAAVKPGATDTPGDGVDQDCAGGDATTPPDTGGGGGPTTGGGQPPADAPAVLSRKFKPGRRSTRIVRLALSRVTVGATVKIACKGRGCPFRSKTDRPATGTLDVRRALKRKSLRAGTVLTITIARPGQTTQVFRLKFRRGKSPAIS